MDDMGEHDMETEGDIGHEMDTMMPMDPGDPQIMENVLQLPLNDVWDNQARRRGVEAAGWAWSAKFGDLDKDGYLDLYIANGMIGVNMFAHLPNNELIEQNQAYHNLGNGVFEPASQWRLNVTESGRGMVMADLDQDGDLDIVINNLRASAFLYENSLCNGQALEVELFWPDSTNSRAIGAQLRLQTSIGTMTRDLRASGGYLSGDPFRVHFGFPEDVQLLGLTITWPDGAEAQIDDLTPQTLVAITR
jgi:hypothetical protein